MNKKNIIVYGNCQSAVIAELLGKSKSISENYTIYHHFTAHSEKQQEIWLSQAEKADLFLIQDTAKWEDYPYRNFANDTRSIRFPFIYFAALWPFDAHQGRGDDFALQKNRELPDYLAFAYQDSLLGRLRTEIGDPEDRFNAYCDFTFKRPIDINRFAAAEAIRLAAMDTKYNISIGQYILDNYKIRRLFHTVTHPTLDLSLKITQLLANVAGISFDIDENNIHDQQSWYQVPLHPNVIEKLGIEWADNNTRYRFRDRVYTFEMYYRSYIHVYG